MEDRESQIMLKAELETDNKKKVNILIKFVNCLELIITAWLIVMDCLVSMFCIFKKGMTDI